MSDDDDDDNNGQTPGEFAVSFILLILGTISIACCLICFYYHQIGKLYQRHVDQGSVVEANVVRFEQTLLRPGQSSVVVKYFVTIEYWYSSCSSAVPVNEDNNNNNNNEEEQVAVVTASDERVRISKRLNTQEMYALVMHSLLLSREDYSSRTIVPPTVEVLVLAGHSKSAYPKTFIDAFLKEHQSQRSLYYAGCGILVTVSLALLVSSILIQCSKEQWNSDYDIAPLVWMILPPMMILGTIVCCMKIQDERNSIMHGGRIQEEEEEEHCTTTLSTTPLVDNEQDIWSRKNAPSYGGSTYVAFNHDTLSLDDLPNILARLDYFQGFQSTVALHVIYELCNVERSQNRIPMVCSDEYDVLTPLAKYLLENETGDARRFACLALTNLSNPIVNKRVMGLGPASKDVIAGLCKVIAQEESDSYLCWICLMNMSTLDASLHAIMHYSPVAQEPLDDPNSLLRVLEKCLAGADMSAISNTVLWACGLLTNLSKSKENASLIGQTEIPKCIVAFIRATTCTTSPSQQALNGLEDFSFLILVNLSQWSTSRAALVRANASAAIDPILKAGGLEGQKAILPCIFLGSDWTAFPDSGLPAAQAVTEVMVDTAKKDNDGQYACCEFERCTATKAYRDLVRAAFNAKNGAAESAIEILTSPAAIASLLQIISNLVADSNEATTAAAAATDDGVSLPWCFLSAEYAIAALETILPAILQTSKPTLDSFQSNDAAKEISRMLLVYANGVAGISDGTKARAIRTATEIQQASSSEQPILQAALDAMETTVRLYTTNLEQHSIV